MPAAVAADPPLSIEKIQEMLQQLASTQEQLAQAQARSSTGLIEDPIQQQTVPLVADTLRDIASKPIKVKFTLGRVTIEAEAVLEQLVLLIRRLAEEFSRVKLF